MKTRAGIYMNENKRKQGTDNEARNYWYLWNKDCWWRKIRIIIRSCWWGAVELATATQKRQENSLIICFYIKKKNPLCDIFRSYRSTGMVYIPTPKTLNSNCYSSSTYIRKLCKVSWWGAGANIDNWIIFKYRVVPRHSGGSANVGPVFTKGK